MVVENGTGLSDADSYVDVDFADNYYSARGETFWADLTDEKKEVYLIVATDFIDKEFDFYGKALNEEQALSFPRLELALKDGRKVSGVPTVIKQAVCEAVKIVKDGIDLFLSQSENGAVTSEHIGDLSFTYDVSKKVEDKSLYDSINSRLRGLYRDTNKKRIFSMQVLRAR